MAQGPVKILVVDGCEPCVEVKELARPLIEAGEVRLVDGMSDEGQQFLQTHPGVDHVPYAFVDEGQGIRQCKIRLFDDGIEFDCDDDGRPR